MVVLDIPLPTIEEGKRLLQVLCHTQDVELNRFVRAICQRFFGTHRKRNTTIVFSDFGSSVLRKVISHYKLREKEGHSRIQISGVLGCSFSQNFKWGLGQFKKVGCKSETWHLQREHDDLAYQNQRVYFSWVSKVVANH